MIKDLPTIVVPDIRDYPIYVEYTTSLPPKDWHRIRVVDAQTESA
jgi:hypothetical protein